MALAQVQDQQIFYEDIGSGEPVVLGHSFLCTGDMWREQIHALKHRYRFINPDFRGHGRSSPVRWPFTLYDAVDDVVGVLDALNIERAVWCGLSVGGMVALRAALTVPDRVSAIIIMDSDAGAERWLRKLKYRLMGVGTRTVGISPFLSPICKMMFGATTRKNNPALVDEWRHVFAEFDVPSALRGLHAVVERDSVVDRLAQISVPALVVVGQEDKSLPLALSQQIHQGLPDSKLVEIPKAGHLSALEQPEPINAALEEFLGTISNSVPATHNAPN